jgi:hypothetical protein
MREAEGEQGDVLGRERESRASSWRAHPVEPSKQEVVHGVPREPPCRCLPPRGRRQGTFGR